MVTFAENGGISIARLPADVDASNADTVNAEIMANTGNHSPALVIDLTRTRYLDSAGIDMLFRLHERLLTRRQRLLLVLTDDAPLMRVLRIVAVHDVMPVHATLDAALRSVGGLEGQPVERG